MPPAVIADRYQLKGFLGRGGMAIVHLALDRRLGREVAVKLLDGDQSDDPHFVERFRREARAAAALNHPSIVSVFDWGMDERVYYMVMEYVPGPTLKAIIRQNGRLTEAAALDIAIQVATALEEAHTHGVIHRDIKPHNILLTPTHEVKVADFGIARALGVTTLTQTNALSGTAQYMSPEQAQLHLVDGRSDLYSLGIVLYEMLAGRVPFLGDSMVEVAMQHVYGEPASLHFIRPDLGDSTVRTVATAMQKDPALRFQTAGELRTALRAARSQVMNPEIRPETEGALAPSVALQPNGGGDDTIPAQRVHVGPTPRDRRPRSQRTFLFALPAVAVLAAVAATLFLTRPTGRLTIRRAATPIGAGIRSPLPTAHTAAHRPTATTGVPGSIATIAVPTNHQPPPVQVVQRFYSDIVQRDFTQAAQLWTERLRSACAPHQCIDQRFAHEQVATPSVSLVGPYSASATTATVFVDLRELQLSPTIRYHYVGDWNLVRIGNQWLMDSELFQLSP